MLAWSSFIDPRYMAGRGERWPERVGSLLRTKTKAQRELGFLFEAEYGD